MVNEDEIAQADPSGSDFKRACRGSFVRASGEDLIPRSLHRLESRRRTNQHAVHEDGGNMLELRHQADRINNCYFTLAPL